MSRSLSSRLMRWTFALIVSFALMPILSVMASIGAASVAGCQLDEASAHRCVVLGIDIGGLLALMFVAGWFALATIPLGGGALLIWAAVAIVLFIRSRNKAA